MNHLKIRLYREEDKISLLAILQQLVPTYFASNEVDDFKTYLDIHREYYFVVEDIRNVIAGGGLNILPEQQICRLSWDFVHPDHSGKGLGRRLVEHRLKYIIDNKFFQKVEVRTSQMAYKFYEKMGFERISEKKDYWALGYDLIHMIYNPNK